MKLQEPNNHSAIIYEDSSQSIFILDIPHSIELAQRLSPSQNDDRASRLLSCSPLQAPYPGPSPEPKTDAARRRVIERTPASEREIHASIVPVVSTALEHVRKDHTGKPWCFARRCIQNSDGEDIEGAKKDAVSPKDYKNFCQKRKRRNSWDVNFSARQSDESCIISACKSPPIILAPGSNSFPSTSSIQESIIKNQSPVSVILQITSPSPSVIAIPPKSTFLNTHLTTSSLPSVPFIPKFNLILLDPPWHNRSVHRSMHYHSNPSFHTLHLLINNLITMHLQPELETGDSTGIVGIWTTNAAKSRAAVHGAFRDTHLEIVEEWIWVKCTTEGEPVLPLDGVWRRPYEVLIWGRRRRRNGHDEDAEVERKQRVIFAVPDIHSRKPNLKELVERAFFTAGSSCASTSRGEKREKEEQEDRAGNDVCEYTALEVFARNLTAGWWACGDEVLRFNYDRWWSDL